MSKSITLVSLILQALKQVSVEAIVDRVPYETRRTALKDEKLLHVLVVSQMARQPGMRGLLRAHTSSPSSPARRQGGVSLWMPAYAGMTGRCPQRQWSRQQPRVNSGLTEKPTLVRVARGGRLVSYQLPDYRWVFVLTDRFDLTATNAMDGGF